MGKEECVRMLCEDWEREYKRKKVRDKERVRDGRRKKRGWPVLIGLCGHAGLRWCGLAKPCASIVGLALHASRAFGQPQLTLVCSLAVSNVRPGRVVPPTSMLHTSGGLSDGDGCKGSGFIS